MKDLKCPECGHLMLEIERLRTALRRQYKADVACYLLANDCTEAEHIAAEDEHMRAHIAVAVALGNSKACADGIAWSDS